MAQKFFVHGQIIQCHRIVQSPCESVSDFKNKSVQESEKVCKVGKQHFLPKNILKTINVVVSMWLVSHSCFLRSEYTKKN